MGAWGTEVFQNDDALDWLCELYQHGAVSIRKAINVILGHRDSEYLEARACSAALAAAEIVAASRGQPARDLPGEASEWLAHHAIDFTPDFLPAIDHAISRIRSDSELARLWGESDAENDWLRSLEDLQRRLR